MSKKSDFKQLQRFWYEKLKRGGFEDIEVNEMTLKRTSAATFEKSNPMLSESKRQYYSMAEQFLNENEFENARERIIWEYHTNAISMRKIVFLLNQTNPIAQISRTYVWKVINRLERAMKLKYLYPEAPGVQ